MKFAIETIRSCGRALTWKWNNFCLFFYVNVLYGIFYALPDDHVDPEGVYSVLWRESGDQGDRQQWRLSVIRPF